VEKSITIMRADWKTRRIAAVLSLAAFLNVSAAAQTKDGASWLDRPLMGWNKAGAAIPQAPAASESRDAVEKRCQLTPRRATEAERAVDAAGWIAFLNYDQVLVREDIEIVGGMRAADGMCRPIAYNLFVFVGGRFAGVLSPTVMTSRLDGSSGPVRILAADSLSAEFARYKEIDPLCCPSSRVSVRYRVNRASGRPIVEPIEIRTTRGG
jgi:hypothetical protein